MRPIKYLVIAGAVLALAGCVETTATTEPLQQPPVVTPPSPTRTNLENLPPPAKKVDIAVYQFPDLTGKNEPNDNVAVFSRAVTQGGSGLIVDALKRAGGGNWFTVVERTGLNDLLQERQLIRATRQEYDKDFAKPLPPIRFAGLIVEGGILTYDANTITGGVGANFLGIGANTQYRRDVVTVGVRIVSVQTGEVLSSVTTTKTVYSMGVTGSLYKFVSTDKILQIEAGFTRNEPTQLAVRQAIDLAVYATIMEGTRAGIWNFADPGNGQRLIQDYIRTDEPRPAQAAPAMASVDPALQTIPPTPTVAVVAASPALPTSPGVPASPGVQASSGVPASGVSASPSLKASPSVATPVSAARTGPSSMASLPGVASQTPLLLSAPAPAIVQTQTAAAGP